MTVDKQTFCRIIGDESAKFNFLDWNWTGVVHFVLSFSDKIHSGALEVSNYKQTLVEDLWRLQLNCNSSAAVSYQNWIGDSDDQVVVPSV